MAISIKAIKRGDLDVAAYDRCVRYALHSKIYAQSWYLDAISDSWYVLMTGDYEAVMPVPVRRKWGISYVYQPPLTQQLGVFSENSMDFLPFYKEVLSRHIHIDYTVHGAQTPPFSKAKPNYILNLSTYENFRTGLSKNRKRDLEKASQQKLTFRYIKEWDSIHNLLHENPRTFNNPSIAQIEDLFSCDKNFGHMEFVAVFKEEKCLQALLFGRDHHRLYYLYPVVLDKSARTTGASTYIINELIKQSINEIQTIDFEGSYIPGVQHFYKSFGAELESYHHIHKSFFTFFKHART